MIRRTAPRGLIVAAPASGAGKTLVTAAIASALRRRGTRVACLKVGPDYIDPRFLEAASVRPAPNLDLWAMRPALADAILADAGEAADVVLIEGVMGLFDGAAAGGGSTADVARRTGLPVVLVVDASRQSQSIAALVHGFSTFDRSLTVAGVILTKVASDRHERLLREALAGAAGPPLIAVLRSDPGLALASRHLGLVQAMEVAALGALLARAGAALEDGIDALTALAAPLPDRLVHLPPGRTADAAPLAPLGQRIAVARDEAFAFAYPHLLAGWRRAGAELAPFSPLADEPPAAGSDAVFLPGGYPELHAGRLAASHRFLSGLRASASSGALIYGECGGYMVLGETLIDADGTAHALAGLLPVTTSMRDRRLTLGYRRLSHASPLPWPRALSGHEFHYSAETASGTGVGSNEALALFGVTNAESNTHGQSGLVIGRVMGSYAHVIDAA